MAAYDFGTGLGIVSHETINIELLTSAGTVERWITLLNDSSTGDVAFYCVFDVLLRAHQLSVQLGVKGEESHSMTLHDFMMSSDPMKSKLASMILAHYSQQYTHENVVAYLGVSIDNQAGKRRKVTFTLKSKVHLAKLQLHFLKTTEGPASSSSSSDISATSGAQVSCVGASCTAEEWDLYEGSKIFFPCSIHASPCCSIVPNNNAIFKTYSVHASSSKFSHNCRKSCSG